MVLRVITVKGLTLMGAEKLPSMEAESVMAPLILYLRLFIASLAYFFATPIQRGLAHLVKNPCEWRTARGMMEILCLGVQGMRERECVLISEPATV